MFPARAGIKFPFLFGRAFIEAIKPVASRAPRGSEFPFLFGRAFIEALGSSFSSADAPHFPSFSEGLSLRRGHTVSGNISRVISLPFRKGFH